MAHPSEQFIKPGVAIDVEHVPLAPIRTELQNGEYVVDSSAQSAIEAALVDPDLSEAGVRGALDTVENKGFRNAYTSLILERVWPDYEQLTSNGQLHRVGFTEGRSYLTSIPHEAGGQAPDVMADLIADTNQDAPTHLICELFFDGKIPAVSGDPAKDSEYFRAFEAQADLITSRTNSFFPTTPKELNPASRFIASSLVPLRTHIFGIPNLMDGVAARQATELTPRQHRDGFTATMAKTIPHYYLPSGPLVIDLHLQLVDMETGRLRPERWTSNGQLDDFIVYPKAEVVAAANDRARKLGLPPRTHCPAFHARVPMPETSDSTTPLPRSLAALALKQLDAGYYPLRQETYDSKPGTFFVERPDWAVSGFHALDPSFPNGLFKLGEYAVAAPENNHGNYNQHVPLSEREAQILARLGAGNEATKSFSTFMDIADGIIAGQELSGAIPSAGQRVLQRFYRRLMVNADAVFDANRSAFSEAAKDGKAFLAALYALPITRLGDEFTVSAGEAIGIFNKAVADPSLHTQQAREIIQESAKRFLQVGVAGMSRVESASLNGRRTQQIKETTNGLYAGLLFDITYGSFANLPGYANARDRYIATKLAYQYNDEVLDVTLDAKEGSSNLVCSLAAENGELAAVQAVAGRLESLLPPNGLDLTDPTAITPYCQLLSQVAPKSYALVADRQRVLLRQASMPPDVAGMIALPLLRE